MEAVAIRLADYLSGMCGSIRVSCSAQLFSTISIALSIDRVCVCTDGNANPLHPTPSAIRTSTSSSWAISSSVGTCPFGGKASFLLALMTIPMLASSRCRKGTTSTVSDVTSTIPMLTSSR